MKSTQTIIYNGILILLTRLKSKMAAKMAIKTLKIYKICIILSILAINQIQCFTEEI